MSEEWGAPTAPRKSRRWLRWLGWTGVGLLLLVILGYFVGTSSMFIKSFVLPRVSEAVHATITVSDTSVSPFFKVILRDLRVQTGAAEEPLLTAREVRARYSLIDILRGKINVREVTLDSPLVYVVQYANGSTTLDALLKSSQQDKKPEPAPGTSPPPQVNIQAITLTNGTVRLVKFHAQGSDTLEVSNLNITLSDLANEQSASLGLGADIKFDRKLAQPDPKAPSQLLQARLGGGLEVSLTTDLKPQSAKGSLALEVVQAPDAFRDLAGLNGKVTCDLTLTELRQLALAFTQNGKTLGQITAGGPLNLNQLEGHLKIELSSIDRQVLNLAGAALGIDFGTTTINAAQDVVLAKNGQSISVTGNINANQLTITQKGTTTRPLDLRADYNVAVDRPGQTALIQAFTLSGTQDKAPLLSAALSQPMKLSFGDATNAVDESALDLTVTNLSLADWRAFIGDYAGSLSLQLHLLAREAGKKISLQINSQLANLSANLGSNRIAQAGAALVLRGGMNDFHKLQIDQLDLTLSHQDQPALTLAGAGQYDTRSQEADLSAKLEGSLPRLTSVLTIPGFTASSGALSLQARVIQKNSTPGQTNQASLNQTVAGHLSLESFTASYAHSRFEQFEAAVDFDVGVTNQLLEIQKLAGSTKQNGQPAGAFEVSGAYHLTNQTGQAAFKVRDLNQNTLRPFLAEALGEMKLVSASINVDATAQYDAKGESAIKGEVQAGNVLITDPKNQFPKVPMTAEVKLNAGLRNDLAIIRELVGNVRQGDQSGGKFEVSGEYHLAKQSGQVALKIIDLNQNALRPFLASALGERTLNSVSINAQTTARYDAKGESAVTGDITIANLLLTDPRNQLPKTLLATQVKLDGSLLNQSAEIRQFSGSVTLGNAPGGSFALSGRYNLTNHAGQVALKLTDLNQNALAPFLVSALGEKKLSSVSVNVDTTASYDPKGAAAVKGRVAISNLLVEDPSGKMPKTPLAGSLDLNVSMANQLLLLDQVQLTLSPTERAKNQLTLSGKLDLTRSNAMTGGVQLVADSLDATPYYDLFAGQPDPNSLAKAQAGQPSAQSKTPGSTGAQPKPEPAAIQLPFRQFNFELSIGAFYLREMAINNWHATAQLDGGQILLKPFQLFLNGAPLAVTAILDLGVPGWKYDVTLGADKIPLEPVVNTFSPGQRGQLKADLFATARLKGQGITGVNLRTNLQGQLGFSLTNANVQIASPRLKSFLNPIALVLGAPDLLNSPLSWIGAAAQAGGGKINLEQFNLASPTFTADTQGDIRIADVLTDSPLEKLPMHFYLRRDLAQKIKMMPKNTPPDAAYVKLPEFIQVAGSLGEPKAELNKVALAGTLLEKLADKIPGANDKTGSFNPLNLLKPKN